MFGGLHEPVRTTAVTAGGPLWVNLRPNRAHDQRMLVCLLYLEDLPCCYEFATI
jgi:hypothetical protein